MGSGGATTVLEARPEPTASGLRRIAAISTSLVSTQAATSVLGLLFWGLAARRFDVGSVGVAGAAISLMTLLGTLGSLGLGTLLVARIPHTSQGTRRVFVRTALLLAGGAAALLAVVVPFVAIQVFGTTNLTPVAGSPGRAAVFAIGTALMAVALVLDQAVLMIGTGALQLERNVIASGTKVAALAVFSAIGQVDGLVIFAAWALGTLVSLPVTAWRTRGGRILQDSRRLIDLSSMRGLGRTAAGHHALNITLMAPLMLLPLIVTVLVSPAANGVFTTALQVTGFVFALPYAVSIGLFAAAEGDESRVIERMRFTVPFGFAVSLLANLALFPLAPYVLGIFGSVYAEQGADILRVLVIAGLPFVIKDHFVALRRVQGRTLEATTLMIVFTGFELVAALVGARTGGTLGLAGFWVGALVVEAVILSVPLVRGALASTAIRPVHEPMIQQVSAGPDPAHERASDRKTDPEPGPDRRARISRAVGIGPLLLLMSVGLLATAWAVSLARTGGHEGAAQLWYVGGLIGIFLPAAAGVLWPGVARGHRIVLAVAMPVFLQLSREVLYPTRFMFHDELLHANALRLIGVTGKLFTENPLLPITSYYPGLEIATDGIRNLTGLSAHTSAVLVLLVTRVVLALAVFGVVERISSSTRVAAVAGVVYATNPQLLFFNSQFSYQTIALPLSVLTVYLFLSRRRGSRLSLVLPLLALTAVSFSHHVTAGLLLVALAVWLVVELALRRRRSNEAASLAVMVVASAGLLTVTVLNPGNTLASYLGDILTSSGTALQAFAEGKQSKQLFENSAGVGTAPWEQALTIASLAITVLVLVPALLQARAWLRTRTSAAVLLCLVAVLYPVIPGGHLTRATAEVGDRAAGFVFLGVGFVVAWWLCRRSVKIWHATLFAIAATVTFLGGVVLGAGPVAEQLPGPFQVAADARSMDPANIAGADWIAANLPPESRVYADRDAGLLAAAYGGQFTVRHISTNIDASRLLLDPEFGPADVALIRSAGIRYVIADRRDAFGLPNQGVYIESGEFGGENRTEPVPAAALRKFDAVPGVDRIYDNGAIVIYDVGALDD